MRPLDASNVPDLSGVEALERSDYLQRDSFQGDFNLFHRAWREQKERFNLVLEKMSQGLCFFDGSKRLIVANRRYSEIYDIPEGAIYPGISLREVVALRIQAGSFPAMSQSDYLASREGIVAAGLSSSTVVELANGRVVAIHHEPLPGGAWVATHDDITEQRRIEAQLRQRNLQFDSAIENMSHGLCMFDADERMIVCNSNYLRMFGHSPQIVQPGVKFYDILRHSAETGATVVQDADELYRRRRRYIKARKPATYYDSLTNGKTIAISHRPMADGGWVAIYEDVTEQREAEQAVREQNRRFNAALENMGRGLCMFDAQSRVLVCNRQYLDFYGLEALPPGTAERDIFAHLVQSGLVAPEITVESMEESTRISLAGKNRVPVYREFTNGRIVSISPQPMAGGGWVATVEDITERRQAEARVAYMASHDTLTDLPNRASLREALAKTLSEDSRTKTGTPQAAVLFLDLDRFKAVNDSLGHAAGDRLLREVAARLRGLAGEGDLAARLGGDEFAILRRASVIGEIEAFAQRVIKTLAAPYDLDGQQANIGASIGISIAPCDGTDPEMLLKCADLALYRAKGEGGGTHFFFEPEMNIRAQQRHALELELRQALALGQFELHYQPQINVAAGRITGAEALLRWRHPTRGLVAPGEFIEIAEEIGLIIPIGEWVIRQACLDAAQWRDETRVAVNLSAAQFTSKRLAETVISALASAGLRPGRLELEITESVLLEETPATLATLHQLRNLGVRISMDDFGTGYSSLSYLRSFPFDKIKIDRSFVHEVTGSANGAAIVRAIAGLGASLGMETTAEGVETKAQLDLVQAEGCTEVQGYYFSPPRPVHEILLLLGPKSRLEAPRGRGRRMANGE